ncbi:MAG TPA: nicotinate-nucleotide--dimethylbenzimidazole phosphoribosyltransferase [Chloroflexota bacterium]
MSWEETANQIPPVDQAAIAAMRERVDQLTKPTGSLGRLEDLAVQLAGIAGTLNLDVGRKVVVVAAGDHGVAAEGVSAYPQEVTGQMLALFAAGHAAINIISQTVGADVIVVDAGVAQPPADADERVLPVRVGPGTADFLREPAMTHQQAATAVEAGIRIADDLISDGAGLLAAGDMGIANTTSAAAIIAAITGADSDTIVGRGTGVDDAGLVRKREVIQQALALHRLDPGDGLAVLVAVGGFEIGVMAGIMLGAAARQKPVVIDGVIAGAAALIADRLAPAVRPYLIAGHRSTEPAHSVTLAHLGLEPLLDLSLHLGEGTGAALAFPIVEAAARLATQMWTFAEAGVAMKSDAGQ